MSRRITVELTVAGDDTPVMLFDGEASGDDIAFGRWWLEAVRRPPPVRTEWSRPPPDPHLERGDW